MRVLNALGFRLSGRGDKHINTMVFTKNGYARAFTSPNQPNNAAQGVVKAIFALIAQAWAALVLDTQLAWNAAATSGDWQFKDTVASTSVNPPSGKALFQSLNGNVLNVGGALLTDVPVKQASGDSLLTVASFGIDDETPVLTLTYTGALEANEVHVVEMSRPLSSGTTKLRVSALRKVFQGTTASAANAFGIAVLSAYQGQFAEPYPPNSRICYRIKAVNTVTGQYRPVGEGVMEVFEL